MVSNAAMTDAEALSIISTNPEDIVARLRARAHLWRGAATPMMREHSCYIDEAADEIERLRQNLNGRDDFLGAHGLWDKFVQSLPRE